MKRKYILIVLSILFIGVSANAQTTNQVSNIWKLSPVKILTLKADQSFSYKKGANKFNGTYEVVKSNDKKELIMYFENETINYIIENYEKDMLELVEFKSGKTLKATLLESFYVQEEIISPVKNNNNEMPEPEVQLDELSFKEYSKIIFNIYGGVSLTRASHQNLGSLDFSFAGASNKRKYKPSIGYQFGAGLGYKIIDGFYIGTGIEASKIGFIKYEEVANDPDVDPDNALVFLESRYSVIGIHIPITAEIFAYKALRIKSKFFASHFLSTTSQVAINAEGSYYSNDLQENLSFLSENEVVKTPEDTSSFSYGYGLELQYYFAESIGVGASYIQYNEYLSHNQRSINNAALGLNLVLSF